MSVRLKFISRDREVFYFVSLGDKPWPYKPALRMISATTREASKAAEFATIAEAQETYGRCGEPDGWEIEPLTPPAPASGTTTK
jgi:hypothetical protein